MTTDPGESTAELPFEEPVPEPRGLRSWEPAEMLAAAVLGVVALRVVFSIGAGIAAYTEEAALGGGPFGDVSFVHATALEVFGGFADIGGVLLLVVALVALWWQADQWSSVLDDGDAEAASLRDAATHLTRAAGLCIQLVVLSAITVVGAITNVIGEYDYHTHDGDAHVMWTHDLGVGGLIFSGALLAAFVLFAAWRIRRACTSDVADLRLAAISLDA